MFFINIHVLSPEKKNLNVDVKENEKKVFGSVPLSSSKVNMVHSWPQFCGNMFSSFWLILPTKPTDQQKNRHGWNTTSLAKVKIVSSRPIVYHIHCIHFICWKLWVWNYCTRQCSRKCPKGIMFPFFALCRPGLNTYQGGIKRDSRYQLIRPKKKSLRSPERSFFRFCLLCHRLIYWITVTMCRLHCCFSGFFPSSSTCVREVF